MGGRKWQLLFLALISISCLISLLLFLPPTFSFSILNLQISILIIFFPLIFLLFYSLSAFFLKNALQGILIGVFVCFFLGLRLAGLGNALFSILLTLIFICIEVIFWKRNR